MSLSDYDNWLKNYLNNEFDAESRNSIERFEEFKLSLIRIADRIIQNSSTKYSAECSEKAAKLKSIMESEKWNTPYFIIIKYLLLLEKISFDSKNVNDREHWELLFSIGWRNSSDFPDLYSNESINSSRAPSHEKHDEIDYILGLKEGDTTVSNTAPPPKGGIVGK